MDVIFHLLFLNVMKTYIGHDDCLNIFFSESLCSHQVSSFVT